jgi:prepilin-type N-terminal cleavage/methylation domain-containing protein
MKNVKNLKNTIKGFTLIELLVVIAIIGILSSVILASLNTARNKGADAAATEDLNNIRAQAEIVYGNGSNSYLGVCTDPNVVKGVAGAAATEGYSTWGAAGNNTAAYPGAGCNSPAGGATWVAWVSLKTTNNYWCVDNTGTAYLKVASPGSANPTSCGTSAAGTW